MNKVRRERENSIWFYLMSKATVTARDRAVQHGEGESPALHPLTHKSVRQS